MNKPSRPEVITALTPEQIAERFRPLDSEKLVGIESYHITLPPKHLSALGALAALTAAPTSREIGLYGPSNAANARKETHDDAHQGLYSVFFSRDGHVVARFVESRYPELTKATVLASLQHLGKRNNLGIAGDEQEFGKIPHEIRDGAVDPIAIELTERKDWQWPYYGAVDTTVKNANSITRIALTEPEFLDQTYVDSDGETHSVAEGLAANLSWIKHRMDLNPDGLVEALSVNPKHHANQTWADSPDAFHHADGSWARHHYPEKMWGVASVELQAEVYDTLLNTADLYEKTGHDHEEIDDLRGRAARLKKTVFDHFWVEDHGLTRVVDGEEIPLGGYFARGTDHDDDGALHPLEIRTSDMGQLLDTRLLDGEEDKVASIIGHLFSSEMMSKWGVRTLSTDSARFFEDRYHGGNTWPWVSYTIAKGLDRHGYHGLARDLKTRIWNLYDTTHMMPEFAPGSDRPLITNRVLVDDPSLTTETIHPISQPAQEIQAWTAAAIAAIKIENGLSLDPERIKNKILPQHAIDPKKLQLEEALLRTQ